MQDISEYYDADRAAREEAAWLSCREYAINFIAVSKALKYYGIKSIAELGCGSGFIPTLLPDNLPYVGFDKNSIFLDFAKQKNIKERRFIHEDIRHITRDSLIKFNLPEPILVISFAVLKHFSLFEWDERLAGLLSLADYCCFDVTVSDNDFDDGVDFHHVYVSMERLVKVIRTAGHIVDWNECKRVAAVGNELLLITRRV